MPKLTANQQRWQSIIEDWQQSGLTQSQYCRQHRINVNRFYSWKNQLKNKLAPSRKAEQGVFLPVVIENPEPETTSLLRIRVREVEIEVNHDTDPTLLQKAVQWLGGCS